MRQYASVTPVLRGQGRDRVASLVRALGLVIDLVSKTEVERN